MKTKKIIAAGLFVLGFGGVLGLAGATGGCAYRGAKNYAPEKDRTPTPTPTILIPGGVELLRPVPVAYGTPVPTFDPNKGRTSAQADPSAQADSVAVYIIDEPDEEELKIKNEK